MITTKILSEKVSYFLSKEKFSADDPRYPFCFFYFTGKEIVACDTHWLVQVKNVQKESHYEDKDGYPVTPMYSYPHWERVLLREDQIGWQDTFSTAKGDGGYLDLKRAKQFFTFLRGAVKNPDLGSVPVVRLEKVKKDLRAYAVSPDFYIQLELKTDVTPGFDWAGVYSSDYLAAAFNLLEASRPDTLTIRVEKQPERSGPILILETKDLLILGSPMRNYAASQFVKKG